jgi:hypothetical protein
VFALRGAYFASVAITPGKSGFKNNSASPLALVDNGIFYVL